MRRQRCPLNTFSISDIRNLSVRDPAGRIRISAWPCQNPSDYPARYLGTSTGYVLVTFRFHSCTDYYAFTNPFFPILLWLNHNFPNSGTVLGLKSKKIKIRAPTLSNAHPNNLETQKFLILLWPNCNLFNTHELHLIGEELFGA
jgi:hypothetical protein